MADIQWRGGAPAVAQVSTASIDTYDAATTYKLAMGDYALTSIAAGSVAAAASGLVTLANAEDSNYWSQVTWTNPTGGDITGTGDTGGVPFVASLSVTGGTGTRTDFADDTACTGPHHADEPENYEGGALPSASDTLILAAGPSILYGLDGLSAIALAKVEIRKSYTGLVGLLPTAFATSLDGVTTISGLLEYRATHLELDATVIRIGDHDGGGSPVGSARLFLDQQSTAASRLLVLDTASSVAGSAPAVDYLASDADADVDVRSAPGGVGIASFAADTATVGDVVVSDTTQGSEVLIGTGVTLTNFYQDGGTNRLRAAATVTLVEARGGTLDIDGEGYVITTLTVEGATVEDVHLNTGGAEWTTINLRSGTLRLPLVYDAGSDRSFTTCNLSRGRLEADFDALTGTIAVASATGLTPRFAIDATEL